MSLEDIIAKVKARPELWQTAHPFYKHRFVNARIWLEIAEELQIDEITLRKKWKHVKDHYRKEQKRILANAITKSYWQHYDSLTFLTEEQDQLLSNTNSQTNATEGTEESDDDKKSNSESDDRPLKAKRPKRTLTKLNPAATRPKLPSHRTHQAADINTFVAKSPDAGKLNFILSRLHSMEAAMENGTSSEDTTKNDSDYMFILSLLPIMKKLTDIQKLQFRGKINDWLLEIVTQNEMEGVDFNRFLRNQAVDENPLPD